MDRNAVDSGSEGRFAAFVESMSSILGHVDRIAPFRSYCTGLILPGERKSVEPIAARVEPGRVQAAHQSLHHFVAKAEWSDEAMLRQVRAHVLPMIEKHGAIKAWIIDDTGFPKQGVHSVGVTRQYCGQLGKQDNCQVAVSLSVANDHASLPIAFRLYLPEDWAKDSARRRKAGVPEDIVFKTKPQIALEQIRNAQADGVPAGVVLADAGYGINTAFRTALTTMSLTYVVGIQSSARLWSSGTGPLPPKTWTGQGRPPTLLRRSCDAMRKTNPCRPNNWRCRSLKMLGMRSHGAKARTKISRLVSRLFEFDLPIATIGVRRPMPKSGFSSNGPSVKASRPNIGFRPCRRTRPSQRSSNTLNCAGESSVIIRNSNKSSGSIIMRDEVSEAFTTTWLSASQPMDSWSPSGV